MDGHGHPRRRPGRRLAVLGGLRLVALTRLAGELDARDLSVQAGRWTDLAGDLLRAWSFILPVALVLFVGVENLEHVSVGLPAPGLSVLGSSQYHSVFGVFLLVSLLAALVDALYRWRRDVLVARIAAARARLQHGLAVVPGYDLPWVDRRHGSIAGNRITGRAPPQRAVA